MNLVASKFTVMFDEPFWVGAYGREFSGKYEVTKIVFGSEPRDNEVYEYMLKNYSHLHFTPSMELEHECERRINPKRMQRAINKSLHTQGIGTKAQQALKLQHEKCKQERKVNSRQRREGKEERLFELRQKKKKEKHKGH